MSNDIRPVMSQAQIEHQIMDTADALELLVEEYAEIAEAAGVSTADHLKQQAMMTLAVIEHPPRDEKGAVMKQDAKSRDARIELASNDERRSAAIAAARREVQREAMSMQRARLDALRTLAANVRYQLSNNG
jgi:hypothetical protein